MNRRGRHGQPGGLTLIELLMVIAILVVLWAIIFAALGPVREKGRQAVCISNLRQIGQAIQMYRQDYGGKEPEGGAAYYELGLPPSLMDLPLFHKEPGVCRCPDENWPEKPMCSYFYGIWDDRIPGARGPAPPFSQLIAEKGDEYPLVFDPWHNPDRGNVSKSKLVIVLRLGGRVHTQIVPPATPSWEY